VAADRLRMHVEHQAAIHRAKEAGTYWADRDRRRKAQQPTHVEVDPDAWTAMKTQVHGRGRSLGDSIGYLVHAEIARCSGRSKLPPLLRNPRRGPWPSGRRAQLFARLVVSEPTWQEFRGLAARRGVTLARYVGPLVEAKVKMRGDPDR
jgi:hypothetical protein